MSSQYEKAKSNVLAAHLRLNTNQAKKNDLAKNFEVFKRAQVDAKIKHEKQKVSKVQARRN